MAAYIDSNLNDPSKYFNTVLYNGNSGNQSITGVGFQSNFSWIKSRNESSATHSHHLFDSVRGAQKWLKSDDTTAETTNADSLFSFDTDGFTLGANSITNSGSSNYVSWHWVESATAGFDIVSYTGNATARTISHSLSAIPHVILVKPRESSSEGWAVYHKGVASDAETDFLRMDETNAVSDNANYWNDTAPTSSVFSVGNDSATNHNTGGIIAYLFSEKQGFSKFGSYTGNGATSVTEGPFVYTGFSPSFLIIKSTSSANWEMFDNKRIVAGYPAELHPHANAVESTPPGDRRLLFTSNGFKIDTTLADPVNNSGETYVYMAFAEAPFVNSNGIPNNAR